MTTLRMREDDILRQTNTTKKHVCTFVRKGKLAEKIKKFRKNIHG